MNIVLIVTDTFRVDHLGCYGNKWIRTPHLDRFSERATTFERCYVSSFPTVPARADLLTGKYDFTYLGWAPLPSEEITLAQLLTEAGYVTFGVTDTPFFVRRGYGYDAGFADFQWFRGQRGGYEREDVTYSWRYEEDRFAPVTMSTAERWLEQHYKERFFLYVDTWDPHEPWDPPSYYVEQYHEGYDGQKCPHPCYWDWKEAGLTEEDVRLAHAFYCGEVTMVDRWVGRLLERIESLDLLEKTAIIFTSDHGFYIGEHGLFGKAKMRSDKGFFYAGPGRPAADGWLKNLFRSPETGEVAYADFEFYRCPIYDEVARVPLMVYVPRARPGQSRALVTLPDVMPTILDLVGVEIPDTVQGSSLVPLLEGKDGRVHDIVVTSWPLYNRGEYTRVVDDLQRRLRELSPSTITADEWTLIYSVAGEPVELYHTASDPKQEKNVFANNKDVADQLHRRFVRFLEGVGTDERLMATRRTLL